MRKQQEEGNGQPYYSLMVMSVFTFVLVTGILFYYVQCYKYRERYYNLCSAMGRTEAAGWNLRRLKRSVMEMEDERVSVILKEVIRPDYFQ